MCQVDFCLLFQGENEEKFKAKNSEFGNIPIPLMVLRWGNTTTGVLTPSKLPKML
jgi:hypothetical protein